MILPPALDLKEFWVVSALNSASKLCVVTLALMLLEQFIFVIKKHNKGHLPHPLSYSGERVSSYWMLLSSLRLLGDHQPFQISSLKALPGNQKSIGCTWYISKTGAQTMQFSGNWIRINTAAGIGPLNEKCWETYTFEKKNWISSGILGSQGPSFVCVCVEIKANFDVFSAECDDQGPDIAFNLICYL